MLSLEAAVRWMGLASLQTVPFKTPNYREGLIRPSRRFGYELDPRHPEINAHGFWEPDRPRKNPSGVFRLAVVGDSLAMGFPRRLEERLNGSPRLGFPVEILNFATPSYGFVRYEKLLRYKVLKYQPDAVLISVCQNDLEIAAPVVYSSGEGARLIREADISRTRDLRALALFRVSALFRLAVVTALEPRPLSEKEQRRTAAEKGLKALRSMGDICRERGIGLWMVSFPRLKSPQTFTRDEISYRDGVRFVTEASGLPHLDLAFFFDPEELTALRDRPEDSLHFSGRGTEVFLDRLSPWVEERIKILAAENGRERTP